MKNRTIITHKSPHLDDITGIWLLKRLLPKWSEARVRFITADMKKKAKNTSEKVYVGVAQTEFDEHKGNLKDSATTLVWKFCKKQRECKLSALEKRAMQELVEYVDDEDHGLYFVKDNREFMIGAVLTYMSDSDSKGSGAAVKFGMDYLDGVFAGLKEKQILVRDWARRKEFKTKWGRGVAVSTKVSSKVLARVAYSKGYKLFIYRNLKSKYTSIKAQNKSRVDLTSAYNKVKEIETKAEWYLHHSKKMLICGSDVAANLYLSKLPLKKIIDLVKS